MTSNSSGLHRWAVGQLTGYQDKERNLLDVERIVEVAAGAGCELIAFPENTTYMGHETTKPANAEPLDGPSVTRLQHAAEKNGIAILAGGVVEVADDPKRPYNTSVLIDRSGDVLASYRKIHMFDVDIPGDRAYCESDICTPGEPKAVTTQFGDLTVGFTICFDLRFPWLYQELADAGAQVIFVPAAFTVPTGHDHWQVLLRARAIETQCYIVAPAQYGLHETGRTTFGHSTIIDPWGTVLCTVPDGGDVGFATLDTERLKRVRQSIPVRSHQS